MNRWTVDGEMLGTPGYMSPEQARGEHSRLTTRSDLYSLGAIAYQLLTDDLPHAQDAAYVELVRRSGHEPPRDPNRLNPQLPRALGAVLRKSVALDASQRFATAIQLAEELERWLDGKPVQTIATPWWTRTWLACRRNPKLSAATAVAVTATLTAAVLAGIAIANNREAALQQELAETRQQMLEQSRATVASAAERIVQELKAGHFIDSFKLLKTIEYLVRDSADTDNEATDTAVLALAESRREFARSLMQTVYGEEAFNDSRRNNALRAFLDAMERNRFKPDESERTH